MQLVAGVMHDKLLLRIRIRVVCATFAGAEHTFDAFEHAGGREILGKTCALDGPGSVAVSQLKLFASKIF